MNECCKKAIEEDREIWDAQHAEDLRIQRAEVWEEAAKIADHMYYQQPHEIAAAIRARAADVGKDAPTTLHRAGGNERPEVGK